MCASPVVAPANPRTTWLRALALTASIEKNPTHLLPDLVQDLAARFGEAPALLSAQECWSFAALAQRANRYSRWALAQGIKRGDVAALLMPNRLDYLAVWLGITAVGGVVALINTNLRAQALAHCLNLAAPGHIIVAAELADALATAMPAVNGDAKVWVQGEGASQFAGIDEALARQSGAALSPDERCGVTLDDRALYMYTSGTTGLPKAAIIDHRRLMTWSLWFAGMMDTGPHDRMYNCLPLYHSVGGVVATGAVLAGGGSVFIAEKFSADGILGRGHALGLHPVSVHRRTLPLSGECAATCEGDRTPAEARLRQRTARSMFGTRSKRDFVFRRFWNSTQRPRAIFRCSMSRVCRARSGALPPFLEHRFPAAIVKADASLREPLRGADGLCVRCATDETGLAVGRISEGGGNGGGRFAGYTSRAETEKKILRNVFAQGDAWFSTGDLMRKDAQGFFYFVDRVGDTFRWKGENVATTEVAEAITALPQVAEASVYGVTIPGTDGRAGMAALVLREPLDLAQLRSHLAARLPTYARPLFVRVQSAIAATDTFKQAKAALVSRRL